MSSHVSATSNITDKDVWREVLQDLFGKIEEHNAAVRVKDYHGAATGEGDLIVRPNGTTVVFSPIVVNTATGVVLVDDLNGRRIREIIESRLGGKLDALQGNADGAKLLMNYATVVQFERNLKKKGIKKFERSIVAGKPTVRAFR